MIAQRWRRDGKRELAIPREVEHVVLIDGPNQRCSAFLPVRDQLVDAARIHYRAGKNMRSDFLALFNDGDGRVLHELSKTVGGSETGRPATNNQSIDFERVAFGHVKRIVKTGSNRGIRRVRHRQVPGDAGQNWAISVLSPRISPDA